MAKTTAPLGSFSAHGAVGNALTYRGSNGKNIVSGFSNPGGLSRNIPRTASQSQRRVMYASLSRLFAVLPSAEKAAFSDEAKSLNITGFNLFLSRCLGLGGTDFYDQVVGTNKAPDGFTRYQSDQSSWGIVSTPSNVGGKAVKYSDSSSGLSTLFYTQLGSSLSDIDFYTLVTPNDVGASGTNRRYGGVFIRGSISGALFSGYSFSFTRISGANTEFNVYTQVNSNTIGNSPLLSLPLSWSDGQSYFVRVRAVGNTIFVKVWEFGDVEPVAWSGSVEDNTYSSGFVGFHAGQGINNCYFDFCNIKNM